MQKPFGKVIDEQPFTRPRITVVGPTQIIPESKEPIPFGLGDRTLFLKTLSGPRIDRRHRPRRRRSGPSPRQLHRSAYYERACKAWYAELA